MNNQEKAGEWLYHTIKERIDATDNRRKFYNQYWQIKDERLGMLFCQKESMAYDGKFISSLLTVKNGRGELLHRAVNSSMPSLVCGGR